MLQHAAAMNKQNSVEAGSKSPKSRLSNRSKSGVSPGRSPTGGSYFRNDMTDADAYEDAKEVDMSIQQMKMQFDRSMDLSVMEEEKAASDNSSRPVDRFTEQSARILKPIQEQDEDEKEIKNSLADSAESARFPAVPAHLVMDRTTSEEVQVYDRRGTFKPAFAPDGKFIRERNNEDNFTFSKRETDDNMKSYMKSAENPFASLLKQQKNIIVEEKTAG